MEFSLVYEELQEKEVFAKDKEGLLLLFKVDKSSAPRSDAARRKKKGAAGNATKNAEAIKDAVKEKLGIDFKPVRAEKGRCRATVFVEGELRANLDRFEVMRSTSRLTRPSTRHLSSLLTLQTKRLCLQNSVVLFRMWICPRQLALMAFTPTTLTRS